MRLMISFLEWRDFKICQRLWWWKWREGLENIQTLLFSNAVKKMTLHFFHQNPSLELSEVLKYYESFRQTFNLNLIVRSEFPSIRQFAFQEKEEQDRKEIEEYITYFKKGNLNFIPPQTTLLRIPAGKSSSHTFFNVSYDGMVDDWILNIFWNSEFNLRPELDNIKIVALEGNLGKKLRGFIGIDLEKSPISQFFSIVQREEEFSLSSLYGDVLALRNIRYGKKVWFPREECKEKGCPYQMLCRLEGLKVDTEPIRKVAFVKRDEILRGEVR